MKTIVIATILFFNSSVWAEDDCLISGVFKSDVDRTMTDYTKHNSFSSPEEKRAYTEMFGSLEHEWRCNESRVSMDGQKTQWEKIVVRQSDQQSFLVKFPNGKNPDLTLTFEGPCYKTRFANRNYYEYYCPVRE